MYVHCDNKSWALAINLFNKFSQSANKFDFESVCSYYENILNTKDQKLNFSATLGGQILKILKTTKLEKKLTWSIYPGGF